MDVESITEIDKNCEKLLPAFKKIIKYGIIGGYCKDNVEWYE